MIAGSQLSTGGHDKGGCLRRHDHRMQRGSTVSRIQEVELAFAIRKLPEQEATREEEIEPDGQQEGKEKVKMRQVQRWHKPTIESKKEKQSGR